MTDISNVFLVSGIAEPSTDLKALFKMIQIARYKFLCNRRGRPSTATISESYRELCEDYYKKNFGQDPGIIQVYGMDIEFSTKIDVNQINISSTILNH